MTRRCISWPAFGDGLERLPALWKRGLALEGSVVVHTLSICGLVALSSSSSVTEHGLLAGQFGVHKDLKKMKESVLNPSAE